MKQIIEEISSLLKKGSFRDEQHVRFSIVGRICQALGWDIWNPEEFYTEYPVRRYEPIANDGEAQGRVDVALIKNKVQNYSVDVYIEVKAPGKLRADLNAAEDQLLRYTFHDGAAICILTDGKSWRFYLPRIGGIFNNRLFCILNLLEDPPKTIANVFNQVLKKELYRRTAVNNAEAMHEELRKIKLINSVRAMAEIRALEMMEPLSETIRRLLITQHQENLELYEIEGLLDRQISEVPEKAIIKPALDNRGYDLDHNLRGKKPVRVYIIDEWLSITTWRGIKKALYMRLLSELKELNLAKSVSVSQDKTKYQNPVLLGGGYFFEGHGGAKSHLRSCKSALKVLGIDYKSAVRIEIA